MNEKPAPMETNKWTQENGSILHNNEHYTNVFNGIGEFDQDRAELICDTLNRLESRVKELEEANLSEPIQEFIDEMARMNNLYNNQRYGLAEKSKAELTEKLDDIMRLPAPPQTDSNNPGQPG